MDLAELAALRQYVGRSQTVSDVLAPVPPTLLAATIDRRSALPGRRRVAAELASAVFPQRSAAGGGGARWPSGAREIPAAGAVAAPDVRGRPARVFPAAPHRRQRDARLGDPRRRRQAGPQRRSRLRHGTPPVLGWRRGRLGGDTGPGLSRSRRRRGCTGSRCDRPVAAHDPSGPRDAVPLLRAHLQWPPHPLRPSLCHAGGGLSRLDRAWAADRDAAPRSLAARAAAGTRRGFLVPREAAALLAEPL